MSTSPIRYSATTGGFYHAAIHGDALPTDAVMISEARHRELLDAQAAGRRIIAGARGRPELATERAPTKAQLLTRATAAIKAEARRRILAIASLERQANDNAAIALHSAEFDAACTRRAAIDAIRAASNALEARIASWSAASLTAFDAGADTHWPPRT